MLVTHSFEETIGPPSVIHTTSVISVACSWRSPEDVWGLELDDVDLRGERGSIGNDADIRLIIFPGNDKSDERRDLGDAVGGEFVVACELEVDAVDDMVKWKEE